MLWWGETGWVGLIGSSMELGSPVSIEMIGFWNNKGQVGGTDHQGQGGYNYHNGLEWHSGCLDPQRSVATNQDVTWFVELRPLLWGVWAFSCFVLVGLWLLQMPLQHHSPATVATTDILGNPWSSGEAPPCYHYIVAMLISSSLKTQFMLFPA